MQPSDLTSLEESFVELSKLNSRISGVFDALLADKAECIINLQDSSEFLDTKEEVQAVLKTLHQQSVEKTRILYEDVLTGLVKDIFPNDPENDRVHLNLTVKRNQAALSVEVSNIYGHRRDVFLDKGGSVKSIIAIGLRFIALSRTNRRRFVAFDEADKEMNPTLIPRFANMMGQLAAKIGMQVIYISHHNYQDFEGHARIIRLSRKNGKVVADILSDNANKEVLGWEGEEHISAIMEGVGLTDISLMNVKQHQNTVIELSPLVNVIIGTNDIGKSTIVQALECVARNKGRVGLIRDEQEKLRIEVGLEDGLRLVYQYKRRGSPKTKYQLYNQDNVEIKISREGVHCPDWLHGYLGMEMYKNQDLHIGLQGAGNFMLDVNVSDHKRAEILSLNKLCGNSQRMIERHNELVEHHRKITTENRKRLSKVKSRLRDMQMRRDFDEKIDEMRSDIEALKERQRKVDRMKTLEAKLATCQSRIEAFGDISKLKDDIQLINMDDVRQVERINKAVSQMSNLSDRISRNDGLIRQLGEMPALAPVDTRIGDILAYGKRWAALEKRIERTGTALAQLEAMPVEVIPQNSSRAEEFVTKFTVANNKVRESKAQLFQAEKDLSAAKERLKSLTGHACPTCGQSMNFSQEHHHA